MKEFKRIPGYNSYFVNEDGVVVRETSPGSYRIVKGIVIPRKRVVVNLTENGSRKQVSVHKLVMRTFVGEPSVGQMCCHNDGNPENNCITNLRYDTSQGNVRDSIGHGTYARGEKRKNSKLTPEDVIEIRRRRNEGESIRGLARRFGVSQRAMQFVCHGVHWSHVKQEAA